MFISIQPDTASPFGQYVYKRRLSGSQGNIRTSSVKVTTHVNVWCKNKPPNLVPKTECAGRPTHLLTSKGLCHSNVTNISITWKIIWLTTKKSYVSRFYNIHFASQLSKVDLLRLHFHCPLLAYILSFVLQV